uniref:Uncharacterized protein n=1 Tax=Cacopsylla melanoneura TaxID=428564 RepID=A0A8D8RM20_9HEMI
MTFYAALWSRIDRVYFEVIENFIMLFIFCCTQVFQLYFFRGINSLFNSLYFVSRARKHNMAISICTLLQRYIPCYVNWSLSNLPSTTTLPVNQVYQPLTVGPSCKLTSHE